MDFKGSKTEANLMAAFAGESQAHTKYLFYAKAAKKGGFEQIAALFEETALNEKEHAKLFFKELHGGEIAGTEDNLADCIAGEHMEWTDMYKTMAEEALKEGFPKIAALFRNISNIEKEHEERYQKLLDSIKADQVFIREDVVIWKCRVCGHIHVGKAAPKICPVCAHSQSYFEIKAENY
jgi:rubrerythrin